MGEFSTNKDYNYIAYSGINAFLFHYFCCHTNPHNLFERVDENRFETDFDLDSFMEQYSGQSIQDIYIKDYCYYLKANILICVNISTKIYYKFYGGVLNQVEEK